ncbi:DNA-methyltransferase [Cytobacillus gottheilii]|uniref:DNA-methyltransferase n=1 Tax=Cytobacillus gottheilii TaxID=859144 RepID=UPI0024943E0C|nr:site-specific DNA-methyltransferase [Cytobacillus gottheilii]
MINQIIHGDCLKVMPNIPDGSVDMILCDLPYGTTENKWDSVIPLDLLWLEYKRIIKDNGAIVLTAQTPFDKVLGTSNLEMLKYEWIWVKNKATGHLNANISPLKAHENILVFYKKPPTYNPQKTYGHKPVNCYKKSAGDGSNYRKTKLDIEGGGQTDRYPTDVLYFPMDKERYHPTQKPVALFEYLIKTYSNEGDLILDNCVGSGTTPVAAASLNRNFIGIDIERDYVDISKKRLENVQLRIL